MRKRAPKLDRGAPIPPKKPRLPPLRAGEIPGIGARPLGKPYATIALVALSLLGYLIWAVVVEPLWSPAGEYARLVYAPFIYLNGWYQLAVVLPLGIFGWLLERRHGPVVVLGLFLVFGIGGSALAIAVNEGVVFLGAPGGAAALLAAWAVPDVLRARRGASYDSDLLGAAVLAAVLAVLPLVVLTASAVATYAGFLGGTLIGLALSRTASAR